MDRFVPDKVNRQALPARLEALKRKKSRGRISNADLAARAGVSERCVRLILAGQRFGRPSTIRRLEAALDAAEAAAPEVSAGLYRSVLALLAHEAGVSIEAALAADPRRERGPVARVRMRTFYLMVTSFDLTMTAVAKVAGVTKQAVSKSLRDIEDERDDATIDAMLDRVARQVAGRTR